MTCTRILVVEDEPLIALDIEESLVSLGYEVTDVADCAELALASVAQNRPDLVLMDIHLRGLQNGIETAVLLRQKYHLPVIFLTAHADAATLAQVRLAQPFGYIVKPFTLRDLSVAIEVALSRYQAEVSMQKALEKEKELRATKSRFVSIVSHEFRNPLSSILFSLDLLQYPPRPLSPEKQGLYLKRARTAVERMIQLLEEMVKMGQMDVPAFDYQPCLLHLLEFCRTLVNQLQSEATQSIRFNPIGFDDATPLYYLDQKLLRYILTNLITNAVKYSSADSEIKLDLICHSHSLEFRIQDQGIGILPAEQQFLFDAFYRGSNVSTVAGTGLGLSIVKQCVEAHQGTITVESQLGVGTTFIVVLKQQRVEQKDEDDPNY